jgi:predicted phage terminase large subunit-like protein
MNAGLLKDLLRSDFLMFARKALRELEGLKLGDEPYLSYLAREFDQFASGETRRLVVNLPPGHLKTSLGSVCLAAWLLAHEPSLKMIVVSHAEHLSKSIARKIRSILQSAWFRELFQTRIKKGHAEVTDFGTTFGGGVFVTSFHAGFTGRRADVIIVDDPHDIGDDIERIEATVAVFNTALLSRLNDRKNGRVLVIAHRVHEHDLSQHLLLRKNKWRHVALPLVAITDDDFETCDGIWHRRKGELLRPESFSQEDIDDLRTAAFNPDFGMLYQQDLASQGLPTMTAAHFPTFSEPPAGPTVLSVDPGMSDRRTSAFSVVQAWRLTPDRFFLLDQFREQVNFTILRDQVRRFRKKYRPVAILVERAANGHALISELTRKYPSLVRPIEPSGRSKSSRLLVHVTAILSKAICLPASAPWRNDFVREFCEFPKGKFTDQVDATTQLLDHAAEFAGMAHFEFGERAIAANGSGQVVNFKQSDGRGRGIVARVRDGRPIEAGSPPGTIFSIKTEVQY